ncbi:MAG: PDZ domain-containing protein [Kofleriaceae bacterium]|nr:PDZ domain-containing protein [Kofleriaceae bacterium]
MSKGRLGALVLGITPELRKHYGVPNDRGVLVARVDSASPAAVAGLQAGDVITDAGGRVIDQASDLVSAVSGVAKGTALDLKVMRDHKPLSLTAKLTSDPVGFLDLGWFRDMFRRLEQRPRVSSNST